ncbi:MAG: hypothetical protein C7B45_12505 [Sulfobacillus acidophilus]|uniref:Uncharacterized protein n=1 Tax=Sulfobacillus acidophilus TaxID=53633 RepID=A0A2T2WFM7_9FIRM|nr:MAG: hypothetical protein C7B45_12505 [Sulfobacillus acidophilus]
MTATRDTRWRCLSPICLTADQADAATVGGSSNGIGSIEIFLHWALDVVYDEDYFPVPTENSLRVMATFA